MTKKVATLRYMTAVELSWVAGLLEGEGSFRMQSRSYYKKNGKIYGPYSYPRITCGMTDEDVIRRLNSVTGVGVVYTSRQKPGAKPLWEWVVNNSVDCRELGARLQPLMGRRRAEQIDTILKGK